MIASSGAASLEMLPAGSGVARKAGSLPLSTKLARAAWASTESRRLSASASWLAAMRIQCRPAGSTR
ncbi:hypothetical protein D3C81_1399230 [compost metagenome]